MSTEEATESTSMDRVICGLPVDAKILFSNSKGVYKPGIEKHRTKLLQKLGFLGKFLDADEKIILVTTGCSPFTTFEEITMGAMWLMAVKRSLFVFTTKRLFHIPTTREFKYRGTVSQILYQDCRQLRVKWSRLVAQYPTGRTDKFLYIPGSDRAIIKRLKIEPSESDRPSDNPQRNHLCPNCTGILPMDAATCPGCGLEFKNKVKARQYSLLIPGGGYFYTNHPFIGIGDAITEVYLTAVTAVGIAHALRGDLMILAPTIVFAVILAVEKLITIHHSNSFLAEFIPRNLKSLLEEQRATYMTVEPPAPMSPPPQKPQGPEDILSVR